MDKPDLADMIMYLKIRIAQGRGSTLKEEKTMLEIIGRHLEDDLTAFDENENLRSILSELYDEVSYERSGVWCIDDASLQKKVQEILGNK